jgi:hypothetical protein
MLDADAKFSEAAYSVMTPKRIDHVFMVRLWAETTGETTQPDWRGVVEHAASGQRRYFTSLDDLTAFLRTQLKSPIAPPADRDEVLLPADRAGGQSSSF